MTKYNKDWKEFKEDKEGDNGTEVVASNENTLRRIFNGHYTSY
jgi:hypothetical protein